MTSHRPARASSVSNSAEPSVEALSTTSSRTGGVRILRTLRTPHPEILSSLYKQAQKTHPIFSSPLATIPAANAVRPQAPPLAFKRLPAGPSTRTPSPAPTENDVDDHGSQSAPPRTDPAGR